MRWWNRDKSAPISGLFQGLAMAGLISMQSTALASGILEDLAAFQQSPQASTNELTEMPELTDLHALAQQSNQKELPIILMFSAQWCEYCEVLKEHALNPMMKSGLYEDKLGLFRHVGIDEPEPLLLLNGKRMKKSKWAYQLNADLTPTILFIDGQGKEVAQRLVGVSELTLFSALVHARLNDAYKNMGLKKVIPATPELLEKQVLKQAPQQPKK